MVIEIIGKTFANDLLSFLHLRYKLKGFLFNVEESILILEFQYREFLQAHPLKCAQQIIFLYILYRFQPILLKQQTCSCRLDNDDYRNTGRPGHGRFAPLATICPAS